MSSPKPRHGWMYSRSSSLFVILLCGSDILLSHSALISSMSTMSPTVYYTQFTVKWEVTGATLKTDRTSRARVLKLSSFLDAHESSLPSTVSPGTSSMQLLRRARAESHSFFTLNTLRLTFSLDIFSDASPAFQVCVGAPANLTLPNLPSRIGLFGIQSPRYHLLLLSHGYPPLIRLAEASGDEETSALVRF
ncbi:hypothetical protein CPC08DRAFT_457902 [Agrocybe pediades]|nr:hypothetical protein CPC08DRAFT_457902 [Agrocybe pediades]